MAHTTPAPQAPPKVPSNGLGDYLVSLAELPWRLCVEVDTLPLQGLSKAVVPVNRRSTEQEALSDDVAEFKEHRALKPRGGEQVLRYVVHVQGVSAVVEMSNDTWRQLGEDLFQDARNVACDGPRVNLRHSHLWPNR